MKISSHRLRQEEKKITRKLFTSLIIVLASVTFVIFFGLPLLAKTVYFLTGSSHKQTQNTTDSKLILLPPTLDPIVTATNSATISISGYSINDATITMVVNGEESIKVPTDKDGKFYSSEIILKEGENKINAFVVKKNQESSPSVTYIVNYKKSSPNIEISSPSNGAKIHQDGRDIIIIGNTDEGNRLTINDRFVIVQNDGSFSFKVTLSDGDNTIKLQATDQAGNKTDQELKVIFSS